MLYNLSSDGETTIHSKIRFLFLLLTVDCYIHIFLFLVESIGGDGSQMRILTKPRTFQKPIGGNITFPCSVLNLGMTFKIPEKTASF